MNNSYFNAKNAGAVALLLAAFSAPLQAAITPDRTRLIFNESDKSISVTLRNTNDKHPYLAQSWIEDAKGNKVSSPLAVLPPVQRIDAQMSGQVKVQGMPDIQNLPADRESLFFFNVREIPPKSDKPNTLQIALQTRIKLFWRPKALEKVDQQHPWQYQVTLTRNGQGYTVSNPTGYYVVISNASQQKGGNAAAGFTPLVMAPHTSEDLKVKMDSVPVLTFINDYGARMPLLFSCSGNTCKVDEALSRKG